MPLRASFLTLFPGSLASILEASILGRAQQSGALVVDAIDLRAFSTNKHRTVDDAPAGGGAGMVLQIDVVAGGLKHVRDAAAARGEAPPRVILVDARGKTFTQADARRLSAVPHVVFVCGRYEGVDARVEDDVDEVLSVGDFVVTGGELPALLILDAVARLVPGVLGNDESATHESFTDAALLEHRQYTRPVTYAGTSIPPVLLSGNHQAVEKARRKDALLLTRARRPDLFVGAKLTKADDKLLADARVPSLAAVRADPKETP